MKSEIVKTLHAMIDERLFGNGPWPADREIAIAVQERL
jgi:hypothetical protein